MAQAVSSGGPIASIEGELEGRHHFKEAKESAKPWPVKSKENDQAAPKPAEAETAQKAAEGETAQPQGNANHRRS